MKQLLSIIVISVALLGCSGGHKGAALSVREIGTVPAMEQGYDKGVSAAYATLANGILYMAGGCNFPETPAADGGAKRYYKGIYKATLGDTLVWENVGMLPTASAYGATIQAGDKWIIAGGMDENGATDRVFAVNIADACKVDTMPSLPCTVDNTAAAIACDRIYVVGGNADGRPSNRVYALDLSDMARGWVELPAMPSRGRVQPVCAATDEALYVWGGFTPADSVGDALVHTDGLCYSFATGSWTQLADVHPAADAQSVTLSGGTATLLDDTTVIAAGGVDKEIFTDAISGRYTLVDKADYMHKPAEWYSFNPRLMTYNTATGEWGVMCEDESFARAGAIIVADDSNIVYICGELKPGIRSPKIYCLKR